MAIPPGPYRALIEKLVRRRHRLLLSQVDLDTRVGWALGLTAKLECGMRFPSPFFLTVWADALGADLLVVPRELAERPDGTVQLEFAFTYPEPPAGQYKPMPPLIPLPRPVRPRRQKGRHKRRRKGRRRHAGDHLSLAA